MKKMAAAAVLSAMPGLVWSQGVPAPKDRIWASLMHLSFNMWEDHDRLKDDGNTNHMVRVWDDNLRLSEVLWTDSLKRMKDRGLNMVVLDLGDAVKYDSHPEIAVKNAWSTARLKTELAKMRQMGLEPIPKLNFSAGHDQWLGDYSRMVSTETYYKVCGELIAEVISLFGKPRFFHLGYDEETAANQRFLNVAIVRQGDQWWKDFYFFVKEVEKGGVRPWIWSDYAWENQEEFFKKMPKSVLQSNWYYGDVFTDPNHKIVKTYIRLEKEGYDQVPCGTFYVSQTEKAKDANMMANVQWAAKNIADARLKGFLLTNWRPTTDPYRDEILKGIDLTGEAKKWFEKNYKA